MKYAQLEFDQHGTPISSYFDDVYFSRAQGLAEANYVFLEGNDLENRFKTMQSGEQITIAETGFGTGLNFIAAWQCFSQLACEGARMNFVSCEKYPIKPADLTEIYQKWPHLNHYTRAILQQYPPLFEGFHVLEFGAVRLLLMLGDSVDCYQQLSARIDAWFLDGFSPRKNTSMWQPALFYEIARLSHAKSTLATFTVASDVRKRLVDVGFSIEKRTGFGRKRHCLRASYHGINGPSLPSGWPDSALPVPEPSPLKRVAIIGTGIVGVYTAIELQARGYQVQLFERDRQPAAGASGNMKGAIYAKLSAHQTVADQFYSSALTLAQQALAKLTDAVPHQVCGLAQLAINSREQKRLEDFADAAHYPEDWVQVMNAQQLSQRLGVTVQYPGLWFTQGGWVSPKQWVECLIKQHQLSCLFNTNIDGIEYDGQIWQVRADCQQWSFDQVVLANAMDSCAFRYSQHLPLNPIAGQITALKSTQNHRALKAVLCSDRYALPTVTPEDPLVVGSTFRLKSLDTRVTQADHQSNIAGLTAQLPDLVQLDNEVHSGRCSIRAHSPDYLPLVGALSDAQLLKERFTRPLQTNRMSRQQPMVHLPGLWLNVAHGSKGLCSALLSAKLIAAMMAGDPLPVPKSVLQALNPNRFVVRDILRARRG